MIFSFFQRSSKILVSLMKCVIYLHLSFSRTSKLYDCCPKPYVDITYTIHVRRKPLFYTLYLIVPAIIITAMVLVGFYLPPESGERMQLGITVLLAMIVFLQLVYQNLPSTSNSAPLLGKFYIATMFLISLSLAATCVVLNYSYGRWWDSNVGSIDHFRLSRKSFWIIKQKFWKEKANDNKWWHFKEEWMENCSSHTG